MFAVLNEQSDGGLLPINPPSVSNAAADRFLVCGSESAAQNQNDAIQEFIRGTIAESAPVVPISAQLKYNVDAVCEYIVKRIPVPVRDFTSPPQMIVIRSFDVNKPGSEVEELRGGVAGGSILQVRPGHLGCARYAQTAAAVV